MTKTYEATKVEVTTRTLNYNSTLDGVKYRLWKLAHDILFYLWGKMATSQWRFNVNAKFKDVHYIKITQTDGTLTFYRPMVEAPLEGMDRCSDEDTLKNIEFNNEEELPVNN